MLNNLNHLAALAIVPGLAATTRKDNFLWDEKLKKKLSTPLHTQVFLQTHREQCIKNNKDKANKKMNSQQLKETSVSPHTIQLVMNLQQT